MITLQVVAFPTANPDGPQEEVFELMGQALKEGADLVGGCPSREADYADFCGKCMVFKGGRLVAKNIREWSVWYAGKKDTR